MFDDFSKRSKAVRAALDLAEKRGWGDTSLADIAQAAGVSLADLRREFTCKSDILRAFQHEIDAQVLAKAKAAGETQSPRDRLFDLIMTRFELMAPYKGALKRIYAYLSCRPGEASGLLCSTLASQYWMLAGAGAKLSGPGAVLRVSGLVKSGKVFRVWLDDDTGHRQDHGGAGQAVGQWRAHAQSRRDGMSEFLPLRLWVPAARVEAWRARRGAACCCTDAAVCGTRLIQRLFGVGLVARPRQILGAFAGKSVVHRIAGERCVRVGKLEAAIRRANPRAERSRDATQQRPAIRAANRDATAAAEAKIDLRAGLLGILNLVELGFAGGRPAEGHGEQACKSYRHAAHLASSLALRRAL
jgi:hypothetical protein